MIPFNLEKFMAEIATIRDPKGPTLDPQEYAVTLSAPESDYEHHERWAWCREHVDYSAGECWSRRRDRKTGEHVFSFSALNVGVMFALTFRGV